MANDDLDVPQPTSGDTAHAVARSGLGAIPIAGTAAVEVLNAIVTPPLERRRTEWMQNVGECLRRLEEEKGINLEELRDNDTFIDVATQVTLAAIRTSKREKLDCLRNALLNSVLPDPPDEAYQNLFINFVETFSVWHIKILDLFCGPEAWAQKNNTAFNVGMGGLGTIIENAFPEMQGRRQLYDQIGKDLAYRGLAGTDNLHVTMTGHGLLQKRSTQLGDEFIKFVSDPF